MALAMRAALGHGMGNIQITQAHELVKSNIVIKYHISKMTQDDRAYTYTINNFVLCSSHIQTLKTSC